MHRSILLLVLLLFASGCHLSEPSQQTDPPPTAVPSARPTPAATPGKTERLWTFASPIQDIAADADGPYWLRRVGNTAIVEGLAGNTAAELGRYQVDGLSRIRLSLVAGLRLPLIRRDGQLWAGASPLTVLGPGEWEHFAAGAMDGGVLLRAFRVGETAGDLGAAYAAVQSTSPWRVDTGSGFWAPAAAAGSGGASVARRTSYGIEVEDFKAPTWASRSETRFKHPGSGLFYGDPVAARDANGPHWAAAVWERHKAGGADWSCQLPSVTVNGRIVVQGAAVDACPVGQTTARLWLPSLASVDGLGLVLAWQSRMPAGADPGEVSVAILPGLTGLKTFPGFQPRLAASGRKLFLATSEGLFGRR